MAKLTKAERAFMKQFSGAALCEDEILEEAAQVEGPVGEKARAVREAKRAFDKELERIGFEAG